MKSSRQAVNISDIKVEYDKTDAPSQKEVVS